LMGGGGWKGGGRPRASATCLAADTAGIGTMGNHQAPTSSCVNACEKADTTTLTSSCVTPARWALGTHQELPAPCVLNQQLLHAASDGDHMGVQVAIQSGAFLDTRRPIAMGSDHVEWEGVAVEFRQQGLTPLMRAAKGGYLKCVVALLEARASVGSADEDGMQALHFAAASGDLDVGKTLIQYGGDCSARDDWGRGVIEHLPEEVRKSTGARGAWQALLRSGEGRTPRAATAAADGKWLL